MRSVSTDPRAGFSIIELLVVCGLIAVLAAIAIPSWTAYRQHGHALEAKSVVQALIAAEKTYRQRHGKFYSETADATFDPDSVRRTLGVNLGEAPRFEFPKPTYTGSVLTVTANGKSDGAAAGMTVTCTYTLGGNTEC